jgi:uncharacterized glyoxalase superfamily protein PhnB
MIYFRVNRFLTLKLEEGKTNIYVNDELFNQCKFLLLNFNSNQITLFNEIESIDEAEEKLDRTMEEGSSQQILIPPETEFWGHCSNLQVWYENSYCLELIQK